MPDPTADKAIKPNRPTPTASAPASGGETKPTRPAPSPSAPARGKADPPAAWGGKRYHTYDAYLKETFGEKCAKIPLDGGFTCPNRDGSAGGGCLFCAGGGAENPLAGKSVPARRSYGVPVPPAPLRDQYEAGREALAAKWGRLPTIVSFSSFTSTYAPAARLRALYEEALSFPDVRGLTVATRADALPDDVLDLLEEFSHRTVLTVELGLQTTDDETAKRIRRGHDFSVFLAGYQALKARAIRVCVHLINGLPGENERMMLRSAADVASLSPDGVKFHELYVRRGSALETLCLEGKYRPLTREEYVDLLARQIALLPPQTVVERVTGDPLRGECLAPDWATDKKKIRALLDKTLAQQGICQGFCYKCTK